jgi:hypothetical protein
MRVDHKRARRAQPDQVHNLRGLRAALLTELEPEVTRTLQVAVLLAAGHRKSLICRQLGCSSSDFGRAWARLRRAAGRLEVGDARVPLADEF